MKKTKEEGKESLEKKQASEMASNKWREEKTKQLAKQQRERKRKERRGEEKGGGEGGKSSVFLPSLPGMVSEHGIMHEHNIISCVYDEGVGYSISSTYC